MDIPPSYSDIGEERGEEREIEGDGRMDEREREGEGEGEEGANQAQNTA
jgi:hypothetical protein